MLGSKTYCSTTFNKFEMRGASVNSHVHESAPTKKFVSYQEFEKLKEMVLTSQKETEALKKRLNDLENKRINNAAAFPLVQTAVQNFANRHEASDHEKKVEYDKIEAKAIDLFERNRLDHSLTRLQHSGNIKYDRYPLITLKLVSRRHLSLLVC